MSASRCHHDGVVKLIQKREKDIQVLSLHRCAHQCHEPDVKHMIVSAAGPELRSKQLHVFIVPF